MKHLHILALALAMCVQLAAQEPAVLDKITLHTGQVYVGEIVVRNNDIIMIKDKNGTRYQFPLSEIRQIEKIQAGSSAETKTIETQAFYHQSTGNFSGQLEISGGISTAENAFPSSPNIQASLAFGNKKAFGKNLFMGAGLGYNHTFIESNSTSLGFIPVFARIQSTLSDKKSAPCIALDAGYAFSANELYNGGILIKVSAGIIHRITYKTSFFAGIYAGLNSISGELVETSDLGSYTYHGNTIMQNLGVKIGLQF